MKLSVIILNYNVKYFLELCLQSVSKAIENIQAEIIVIDNASADGSIAYLKKRYPNVTYIENTTNLGFPKGNNIGVAQAKGKYLCILNPDTVVAEDTFKKILSFCETKSRLGIVGCHLIDGTGHFLPESKRGTPTPWVAFTKIVGLYKWFPKLNLFNQYYAQQLPENQTGKVDILVGAFMVMERHLYKELGGFDENCFMYSDDVDLSYSALKLGLSNYYVPTTSVIHYKGESTVKDALYMNRFAEAMQFFYKKHFKKSVLFDLFMKTGTYFFVFLKKNKVNTPKIINTYVYIGKNDHLANNLAKKVQKKFYLWNDIPKNDVISHFVAQQGTVQFILDANTHSFYEIISFMKNVTQQNITFKIIPQQTSYAIGSNSSNEKGEIIFTDN